MEAANRNWQRVGEWSGGRVCDWIAEQVGAATAGGVWDAEVIAVRGERESDGADSFECLPATARIGMFRVWPGWLPWPSRTTPRLGQRVRVRLLRAYSIRDEGDTWDVRGEFEIVDPEK